MMRANKSAVMKLVVLIPLLALSACGGGGGDETILAHEQCSAESVYQANQFIEEGADCKAWAVAGEMVDGAPYPDFLIGGDS